MAVRRTMFSGWGVPRTAGFRCCGLDGTMRPVFTAAEVVAERRVPPRAAERRGSQPDAVSHPCQSPISTETSSRASHRNKRPPSTTTATYHQRPRSYFRLENRLHRRIYILLQHHPPTIQKEEHGGHRGSEPSGDDLAHQKTAPIFDPKHRLA